MKALIWNIRSVKSQKAFQRVQMLHNFHKFAFVAILEPFQHVRTINRYKHRLKTPSAFNNLNGKIWVFTNHGFEATVVSNTDQQITLKVQNQSSVCSFFVSPVYAKCDREQRIDLWGEIYSLASAMNCPWLVGGDFNVVLNGKEKIGGLPVTAVDCDDFRSCIESCDLYQCPFKGSPFTRWNGRVGDDCIFERLDRILVNSEMMNVFNKIEIEHLPRTGSDHAPLLLSCDAASIHFNKPCRFLNFWTEHESFKDVVRLNWDADVTSNPFLTLKERLRGLKRL